MGLYSFYNISNSIEIERLFPHQYVLVFWVCPDLLVQVLNIFIAIFNQVFFGSLYIFGILDHGRYSQYTIRMNNSL